MSKTESVKQLLEEKKELLPYMPKILRQLQELISRDTGVAEVEKLIGTDVGLVAKILRIVNSAYYGLPRPLNNLTFAIAYLGFGEIYRIVLTATIIKEFDFGDDSVKRFWRHSYFTALIAKQLTRDFFRSTSPGELWPAALLHDIGMMVSFHLSPEEYRRLLHHQRENQCLLSESEQALDSIPHTVLGGLLCDHWQLPSTIKQVCLYHELDAPTVEPLDDICRIVRAADGMTHLTSDDLRPDLKEQIPSRICDLLGTDEKAFLMLMGDAYDLEQQVDRFLENLV